MDRKTRDELNSLSKQVFGTSSRWQKLVNDGFQEVITEDVTEQVPQDDGTTVERVVKVPKKVNGAVQSVTKRYTVEGVMQLMLDLKKRQDDYKAVIKEMEEKKAAEKARLEAEKNLTDGLTGTARS